MAPDPKQTAARLGLDEVLLRRLEARGLLARLALTDSQVRERLYGGAITERPKENNLPAQVARPRKEPQ